MSYLVPVNKQILFTEPIEIVSELIVEGSLIDITPPTVPRVTVLPTAPLDGQEVDLVVDSTSGIVWRFRYNQGSASPSKWEFRGGPPVFDYVDTSQTGSGNNIDLATLGPTVSTPVAGDYDVSFGCNAINLTGSGWTSGMSFSVGGAVPGGQDTCFVGTPGTTWEPTSISTVRRKLALPATTIMAKYSAGAGQSGTFSLRYLSILPLRVG